MSEALVPLRLEAQWLPPAAAWAEGLDMNLPLNLAHRITEGALAAGDPDAQLAARNAALMLRERRAFLERPPAMTLPFNYRAVPGILRRAIARSIGWVQRYRQSVWAAFPGWPLDLSADLAEDLGAELICARRRTPVLLTHDIDSPEGLVNLVEKFLPLEETAGVHSANFIVPCAWPLDHGLLTEVMRRGHEIGIHGYDHSTRTSFVSQIERAERLAKGRKLGNRYCAAGYRAPSLVRSRQLLADLGEHYMYDSSIPTSGGPFPTFNNGCASARPWRIDNLWELPISLPRDGSLRFLGYDADEIVRLWISLAGLVARSRGTVVLLTHCEGSFTGGTNMLEAYRSFIMTIANDNLFEFIRPIDLVVRLTGQKYHG
jgi:peptidoglycan/xylan/chitin deacetylase (PgdA/CDA1 family)